MAGVIKEHVLSGFSPAKNKYFAVKDGEVLILDLDQDRFFALNTQLSQTIIYALSNRREKITGSQVEVVSNLVDGGWLVESDASTTLLPSPELPGGLSNFCWQPAKGISTSRYSGFEVLALRFIYSASRALKHGGTPALLSMMNKERKRKARSSSSPSIVDAYAAHVAARSIYPRRIHCLVDSAAFAMYAWSKNLSVDFVIGVQNYPFYAHAWVEHNRQVINDAQDVRSYLAMIFTLAAPAA